MRKRFIGRIAISAAITFIAGAGQYQLRAQQRAAQPSAAAKAPARPARVAGHPNLNGIWQALNSANWNLEAHSVTGLPSQFWQLGAIGSIPAGKSVLKGGGTIPYKPEALKQRDENRAKWPEEDNE